MQTREARRSTRPLTIQARIGVLVVVCLVPAWLVAALVGYLSYDRERTSLREHALATTRELLRVVERDLAANEATVQTLAQSSAIDRGDFADFYRQAKAVLPYTSGFTIVLTDASGQQVVNLLRPFGSPLPRHGSPEQLQRVLETGRPVVSDLFIGGVTRKPVLVIEVPVMRKGRALYGLALTTDPAQLSAMLQQQGLPTEWVVSIFDRSGTIVARDRGAEKYVGQKGSPMLMHRMQETDEDVIETPTLEGIPVIAAFSRSRTYGWTVAIGVPETALLAGFKRLFGLVAFAATVFLLAGLGLAVSIGRRIARPVQSLIAPALAIGKGEPVSMAPLGLKEADDVAQALEKAQYILQRREQDRDRAEQAERQMLVAKEAADQASRAKTNFLTNTSHALRTPLNAILGFARLMRNDPDVTPWQIHNLDIINRSGENLLHLINNVLEMSKIESGKVPLEESNFDLGGVLSEISSLMQVRALEKGLSFAVVYSPDLPRQMRGDADKLRQVLINLTGNAIKFTGKGSVSVRAEVTRREAEQVVYVRFEVKDSGPGIQKEDSEQIFSSFIQLEYTPASEEGTGLGLAISKQYVELMGGELAVDSTHSEGSTFFFEIPLTVIPGVEIAPAVRRRRVTGLIEAQQRFRLLIVEDHPENRLLLRALLEPLGFELREAHTGREAVALSEQWRPHLIWMDMRMPDMDGLQATRHIRSTGVETRIVAVTAHALEAERRAIIAAGCDDVIRKPYRDTEIYEAVEKNLGVRFQYAEEQAPAAETTGGLRLAQLVTLPPPLIDELREAVLLLDGQRCLEIVAKMDDHKVSAVLQGLVNNLRYAELLAALDELKKERSA